MLQNKGIPVIKQWSFEYISLLKVLSAISLFGFFSLYIMKLLSNQLNERKIIKLIQQLDKYATLHKLYHEVKVPTPMIDMKSSKIVHKQVDQVTPTLQLSNELDLIFDGDIESDSNTLNAYHAYQKIRKQRYKV